MALAGQVGGVQSCGKREARMEDDDRVKKLAPHEVGMPIDSMSIEELRQRIALLEGEIARLHAGIETRQRVRSAADSLFKS